MSWRGTRLIGIIAGLFAFAALIGQEIVPSHPSGIYDRSILLSLAGQEAGGIYYSFDADDSALPLPYEYPLLLSALPGEERRYELRLFLPEGSERRPAGVLNYTIDKRAPVPPRADLAAGYHTGPRRVVFEATGDTVYYSLDGDISENARTWTGAPVELTPREKPYLLYAYSRDAAGNVSDLQSWEYTIGSAAASAAPTVSVLSPASGAFANPQLLYIDSTNTGHVYYTLDGSDPRGSGTEYTEPVLIDQTGELVLSVVGENAEGRYSRTTTIRFSAGAKEPPASLPPAGVYSAGVGVPFGALKAHYTFEERLPAATDLLTDEQITLFATPRGVSSYALRFRPVVDGRLSEEQYRLFYRIDSRVPAEPVISVSGRSPHVRPPQITLSAPATRRSVIPLTEALPAKIRRDTAAPLRRNWGAAPAT